MSSQNSLDVQGFVVRPKRRYQGAGYVKRPTTVEPRYPKERSILAQMSAPAANIVQPEPSANTQEHPGPNAGNSGKKPNRKIDAKSLKFNFKAISKARASMVAMAMFLFMSGLIISL